MLLRFGGRLFVAVLFLLVGRRRRIGGADAAVDEPEEAERQRRGHGHGDGRDGVDVGLGLRQHQPQHEDGDARVLDARLDGHGHGVLPRLAEDDAGQGAETVAEPHQTYGRHGDGPLDQVHHVQVGVRAEADRHRHDDQRQRLQRLRQHVGHFRPVAADQQPDLCDEQKKKRNSKPLRPSTTERRVGRPTDSISMSVARIVSSKNRGVASGIGLEQSRPSASRRPGRERPLAIRFQTFVSGR